MRTLGANSEQLTTSLRGLSQELGASVSVNELLKASYDVLSSGFTTTADATNILRASALGAQGGFTELGDVVKAVTGVINAYGLSSSEATQIVDGFLQTQNDGVITVRQYASEIGNIASIAAAGGVGLDQLNAAIATATLRGVPVAQTFTGLRQALSSIIKPSQLATELAASLGLQFNVQALQAKGLAGVLADVQQKTGGSADKIAILLGSVEAQAAVQPLLNDNLVKYNELLGRQAQSAGAAAAASKINANTISGNVAKIQNSLSNLATSLDSTLNPVFGTLAGNISKVLNGLNQVLNIIPKGVGTVNGAIAAALVFGPGVGIEVLRGQLGGGSQQPQPTTSTSGKKPPPPKQTPSSGAVLSPSERSFIEQSAALELSGLQQKLAVTQQLNQLDQVGRVELQNRLSLSDRIRAVDQLRLQLQKEQAKPVGSTGSPSEQDPKKILDLQNKIRLGQVEVATQRIQNQQAEAAALRTQQDRVRQQQLELTLAQSRLNVTQQQTQLERDALATGQQVSATDLLRLRTQEAITQKLEQQKAAQQALQAELSKPKNQQDRVVVDDLLNKQARANADVRQAYADAGLALVQNARQAADALKAAEQSFNSTARGNFEFLTNDLQQQQIDIARQSVASGVRRGLIRGDADISSPEKLFRVAGVAESLVSAQDALKKALAENVKATEALVKKDWNIYLSTNNGAPQMLTPPPATPIKPQPVGGGPYGVWGGY